MSSIVLNVPMPMIRCLFHSNPLHAVCVELCVVGGVGVMLWPEMLMLL